MATESKNKKLNDLLVVDLRTELEKRDLDKTGVKAVLLERLQKALKDEGHDPDTYVFELSDPKLKTPVRGKKSDNEEASEDDKGEEEEETAVSTTQDKVSDAEVKTVENSHEEENKSETLNTCSESSDLKTSKSDEEKKVDVNAKVDSSENELKKNTSSQNAKSEIKGVEEQKSEEKIAVKTSADSTSNKSADASLSKEEKSEANGIIDNEDSINLTIGEDEAKLLADEEESSQEKDHKDESHGSSGLKKTGEKTQDKTNQEKTDGKSSQASDKASKDDKNKKTSVVNSTSKNLWVSGLATTTRATDLKQVFSKYGKVIGAKVVTNARMPGARCYGYVTMSNVEDANKAVQLLHHTELHGRLISVEKAKADSSAGPPAKRTEAAKSEPAAKKVEDKKKEPVVRKAEQKKEEKLVPPGTEGEIVKEPEAPGTEDHSGEKKESKDSAGHRSREPVKSTDKGDKRPRSATSNHRRGGSPVVLSFEKIKEERERQRLREKERMLREEQRRRETERLRQREIDRKQREEFDRLEREKKKLKMERERLMKEKDDLMKLRMERQRLERERQKLERERLEKEKEELERLKRQTLRLEEEARRKRSLSNSRDREYESRKRQATDTRYVHHSSSQSTRYPEPSRTSDFKKDVPSHKPSREIVQTIRRPFETDTSRRLVTSVSSSSRDPWISKERDSGRYERTSLNSSNFRDDSISSHKPSESRHVRERYQDAPKTDRFVDRGGDSWRGGSGGGSGPIKSFSSRDTWVSGSAERKQEHLPEPWARPNTNSNRWQGNSSSLNSGGRSGPQSGLSSSFFATNNMQNMPTLGLGASTIGSSFSGGDRFDAYKQPYFKGN